MTQLLVATHNKGKVTEFADMMQEMQIKWLSLDDIGVNLDVEETGSTFQENALLKAQTYAGLSGLLTLADDSGLEVDALSGAPGVYSARYGGTGLTPEARYQLVLQALGDVPESERGARFRCVIVLAEPNGRILAEAEGVCKGIITHMPVGEGGFGYDPIFYIPEEGKTMAELEPAKKNQISHRGRALQQLKPQLQRLIIH